ncbi:MAG TPA: hypothetical protein VFA74_13360 [Terriglobales bacterium]|nr:hypothetical protein [Terriglobales bacterium]
MAAWREFRFDFIDSGASASVFIHGYDNNESVAYSAVVYAQEGQAYYPLGHINMEQTEVYRHVDGTVARVVAVQNLAPFNPCTVDINILAESF